MKDSTINNCPGTLAAGHTTYSPTALSRLFNGKRVHHQMDFDYESNQTAPLIARNVGHISLSGAQEKLSAVVDGGRITLASEGVQGTYILKPIPSDKSLRYRTMMPANEHLTMQIARQVYNIPTAENGLIFFADGQPAYITKRFDIASDGSKIKQEDFSSILGRTEERAGKDFKYRGSYLDVAVKIRELLPAWQVQMALFFRQVVFNYLFANGDSHLKNYSVQQTADGDYVLTPAYDLMNTGLHIDDTDFALSEGLLPEAERSEIYTRTGHPGAVDFRSFGRKIGLTDRQSDKAMTQFTTPRDEVAQLAERSFLDERTKRMYLRSYDERLSRLLRTK